MNRVNLIGTLAGAPKLRSYEQRGVTIEVVSLWIEVQSENRHPERFTVEITCPKAGAAAKAMQEGVIAEINGVLRHDRWKSKKTNEWTGKVYVALDPGQGTIRSKGMAEPQKEAA